MRPPGLALVLVLLLSQAATILAQEVQDQRRKNDQDLTDLNLEELMKVEITSVSKSEHTLMDTPAAVTVIRGEDLRRTGVTSIPEALRLVPGLFVARQSANQWVVASRGFASAYANKLLVLIDGRSVYTPLFSGVFWAVQDVAMEDVDRIEVIRGPGATVWGANAVNGVINVITRKAKDSQGTLLVAGGGTEERAFATARYGGKSGEDLYYRVYVKGNDRDAFTGGHDEWQSARAGFRTDWKASGSDQVTVQGDFYQTVTHNLQRLMSPNAPFITVPESITRYTGGNLVTRWEHTYSADSILTAQMYYDHTELEGEILDESRDTLDLDLHHHLTIGGSQTLTYGIGYRGTHSRTDGGFSVSLSPDHRTDDTASAFLQDEIALASTVTLTLGSKVEYNSYTGFEIEPGLRFSWRPHERHAFWASAARAVRTPSQVEDDGQAIVGLLPGAPPTFFQFQGHHDFLSEELIALEAGYRLQPLDTVTLDLATFHNRYDHLRTTSAGATDLSNLPNYVVQVLDARNDMKGLTWGIEAAALWQIHEKVRLQAGYTFFQRRFHLVNGSGDVSARDSDEASPHHIGYLRLSLDPAKDVQVDLIGRYTGPITPRNISDYFEADARVAWHFLPSAEAALVGQCLARTSHREEDNSILGTQYSRVQRGVYASLTLRF